MANEPDGWDYSRPWYHGSPDAQLKELCADSAITQNESVARVFSHKPSLVSGSGSHVRHDGKVDPAYLYRIAEELGPADVYRADFAGNQEHFEWHIKRPVKLEFVRQTQIDPAELLSAEDIEALREMARCLREVQA